MKRVPSTVSATQRARYLRKLSQWSMNTKQTEISRSFTFPDFVSALAFVAKVTVHAEIMHHHPDIVLSYGKVQVSLTTHDVKTVTKADFELALAIDTIA